MQRQTIFNKSEHIGVTHSRQHTFVFLGVTTNVSFKNSWGKWVVPKGRTNSFNYPPVNEHHVDWIMLQQKVVDGALGTLCIAEHGVRWALRLDRGFIAARLSLPLKIFSCWPWKKKA